MTTPASPNPIYLSQVNTELGIAASTTIYLNNAVVRTLAGKVGSGTAIQFSDLRGKSNRVSLSYSISSSTTDKTVNVSTISGYITGKSDITITVGSGVYVYATSTGNAGLTINGASAGDTVTLVNNGYILGMGGNGGGTTGTGPAAGGAGGPALSAGCSFSISNNGYIAGGGGGGGGSISGGGGGAGGGTGGTYTGYAAGAGGGPGSKGANSSYVATGGYSLSGGGGGRILPGAATSTGYYFYGGIGGDAGGASGLSLYYLYGYAVPMQGGGGSNNQGVDAPYANLSGGGGGWGARGGHTSPGGSGGGAGGAAINKNGYAVSYNGTVYGAVNA